MKSILAFSTLFFALAFCGITDKIKETVGDTSKATDKTAKPKTGSETGDAPKTGGVDGEKAEKANPTAKQQAIIDGGERVVWEDQGMGWVLPKGWAKQKVGKKLFNYGTPATGFLIVSISSLPQNFPTDISLKAVYDQSIQRKNDNDVDEVRYLEIDNVKGVETIEAMPEDKGDPRRHQWQGYRNYNNQVQLINVILSTDGSKFNDKDETFGAILYSMKFDN